MPCFFNDANCNAFPHPGNGWNNGGGADVCTFHYTQLAADIRQGLTFSDALVNDYMKIGLLMRDTPRVLAELAKLNTAMGGPALAALQNPKKGNYVKLSDSLQFFEEKCWFPGVHLILIGLLPGADFLRVLGSGYMAKDVGAGVNHGEFSHRLQWHAIMRLSTNDFTTPIALGWSNSAYDLYCSFGEGVTLQRNLWGSLLDRQGAGDCRDPSYLDAQVRGSGLVLLSTKLNNVRAKRFNLTQSVSDFATEQADRETRDPMTGARTQQKAFVKLGDNYASQLTSAAYASHKGTNISKFTVSSRTADVVAENQGNANPAQNVNANAFIPAQALPDTPAIEILKELDVYEKPSFWKKSEFKVCMSNGAMIRVGEKLLTPEQVVSRRMKSRASLHV